MSDYNFDEFDSQQYQNNVNMSVIDRWFGSDHWSSICSNADTGCEICLEMMERVSDMLGSLIFHLQNKSGDVRVQYELSQFDDLVNEFDK